MNRNSALIWLPKIDALGMPTPKTLMVPYNHNAIIAGMESGKRMDIAPLIREVVEVCEEIGWPCFIRTDLGSAKHSGPSAYLADNPASINRIIYRLVEDQELKFWMTGKPPKVFMVRQFLDLDAAFTAFHGLPISREWRFFADGEKVQCFHPYWPEDVLKEQNLAEGWDRVLADHHTMPECFDKLAEMAVMAAGVCGGDWSVDFAMDKTGKWWLIDMAVKDDSWHWPRCPNGTR